CVRLGESADFKNSHALSQSQSGARREWSGLGSVSLGVHGLSSDRGSVAEERLRPHAVGNVQATVLSGRLVRSGEFAGAEIYRNGNILWSAQFPLATSTWPNTQEALARSFNGVAADDRQKILWENAAKLYKIPFP